MDNTENAENKVMGVGLKAADALVACLIIAKIMGKDSPESRDALEAAAIIGASLKYDEEACIKALRKSKMIYDAGPEAFYDWMIEVAVERLDDTQVKAELKKADKESFVMSEAGHA
jgi:hypothetical protein